MEFSRRELSNGAGAMVLAITRLRLCERNLGDG